RSLRQTRKLLAVHAGTIWRHGHGPNINLVAMTAKHKILCVKFINRPKCWTQAHVEQPPLLLSAGSVMYYWLGKMKPISLLVNSRVNLKSSRQVCQFWPSHRWQL